MIGYLKGKVKYLDLESVILDVHGVGYEVLISSAAHEKLSCVKEGEEGELFTYLQLKEDGVFIFGFRDQTEKALFLKLTSVQGVGAKTALAILSALSPKEVESAIEGGDGRKFAAVKGVGKKTADRIILELHGKLGADALLFSGDAPLAKKSSDEEDALSALMGLGFTQKESARAVERARAQGAGTVEEIIALALKGM